MRTLPTAGRTLRVLLVEDCLADAELTAELLLAGLPDTRVHHALGLQDALGRLRDDVFDVALVDLGLPDAADLQALQALRAADPGMASIVLTGRDEDHVVEASLTAGAQDYLVKDGLTTELLARAVRYAVSRVRAEQEATRSRLWAQSVLDSIEAPTCAVDTEGTIFAVNAAWTRFGQANGGDPARTGVGMNYLAVCDSSPDPVGATCAADLRRLLRTGRGRVELDYACSSPTEQRWFSLRATPVVGGGGAVLTHLDVTALRLAQERLDFAATHDPLTGLSTRRRLTQELDRRLRRVEPGRAVAVFFIDLDRFKLVNDTLGHTAGDSVLVRVGKELTAAVRQGDLVARHGGDEFVVLADVSGEEVDAVRDRLQAATTQRLRIGDADVAVSASIGLAVSTGGDTDTAEDLLRAVDDAMHHAKAAGRGRVALYSEDLRARARARAQLLCELQTAVDEQQFVLHFQPVVVPEVGGVHAVEALLRWQHPRRGLLAPGEFLDVAETTGLITSIGAWVIQEACEQGRRLHDTGLHLSVTVNLSAKQVNDPRTVDVIADALATSGFSPPSLVIELTETSMIDDTEAALSSMRAIKGLGVQLAVDDFGTGYASLAYLRRYPIDGLKIDRSFVRDILTNDDDRAIVTSLLALARELDLWVVAEGVETVEQLQLLQAVGCELVQGFFYSRPVPADELPAAALALAQKAPVRVPAGLVPAPRLPVQRYDSAVVSRMASLHADGMSLLAIAAALEAEGHRTPGGLRWHPRSIARALAG